MVNYNTIDNHVATIQNKKKFFFVTFEVSYVPFHAVILLLPGGNHYTKFWVIIPLLFLIVSHIICSLILNVLS